MAILPYTRASALTRPSVSVFFGVKVQDVCRELLASVVMACVLAIAARLLVAESRVIPSPSMAPTLAIGDRLIVDKLSYRIAAPQRGDIVVFKPPQAALGAGSGLDARVPWVKRLVALPGDRIEIRHGVLFVNEQVCREPYVPEPVSYEWRRCTVPQGYVVVLGDNRNHSVDSHVWGMLPQQNIMGCARLRYWPPSRLGVLATPLLAANRPEAVHDHGEDEASGQALAARR